MVACHVDRERGCRQGSIKQPFALALGALCTEEVATISEHAVPSFAHSGNRHGLLIQKKPSAVSELGLVQSFVQVVEGQIQSTRELSNQMFAALNFAWILCFE